MLIFRKKKKQKMSKAKKKGLFMKIIIIYCLAFIAFTNIWALYILKTTGNDAYGIINAINAVHGGELLFCCLKKIIDSPDNDIGQKTGKSRRNKKQYNNTEEETIDESIYTNNEDCRGEEDE